MRTSEVYIPSFKWCSRYDRLQESLSLQFTSMISAALGALSTETSNILLPMIPVKTSTYLVQRFLFGKVSSYYASMA